jgi:predicted membrane channel-forming protein YqfA (hemolysin III family)
MIALIVTLAVVGLLVWLITTYIPMPPLFKTAIYIVAAICVIFYILRVFGLLNRDIAVPRLGLQVHSQMI